MRQPILPASILLALLISAAALAQAVAPFESQDWSVPASELDGLVLSALREKAIEPAYPCSDEVFLRRAYLDVIGTLPEPERVRRFLQDASPDKRARLIDELFQREEFADYWSLKWGDLLRIKAEFPVNLWPNAVQAYHHWVREAIRENRPYDQFARELLTSNGSNFRVPPVNFMRAVQGREPSALAEAVALTFMGTRLATWDEKRRADMAAFFSRVAYKKTGEWKEEIVTVSLDANTPLDVVFPDGTKTTIAPGDDPRIAFADWLTAPDNPWFARNIVNRIWSWLMGRGIIHEPDDIRPDNPPSNPELLAYLERELVTSGFDLQHIYRLILNSRTYQQSSIPRSENPRAPALFAYYPVRRLGAEVLVDALNWIGGTGEGYVSPIPEPFTFVPESQRTIALSDGSITSPFLEMFGRPARDTGLESERNLQPSDAQMLYLLNSSDVQRCIARSPRLRAIAKDAEGNSAELIRETYLLLLSRYPTAGEQALAEEYWQSSPGTAATDLAWSLINSAEFLYRH
ncbi:MAG: DUF1553 domain-containing protein [Armatimonadetes bacterium]|nr:DUF1553 domain-containing protein [Armatimonadota bacterium]